MTLITGPSGSGKSQTLALLRSAIDAPVHEVGHAELGETPLIESLGQDAAEATRLLTAVGLSDPYTWCRTPNEISCGQLQRLHLAHALASKEPILIADEFLHALDRTTAAAVAWTAQKAVRKAGRSLIVCTTQPEIAEDLKPDQIIKCGWSPEPQVAHSLTHEPGSSLSKRLSFRRGDHSDWSQLAHLHYAAGDPATTHSYWVAEIEGMPGPAGVLVFSYPDLHSAARNLATQDAYKISGSREAAMKLNREVKKLSRIVVSPEVRGIGLSRSLIAHAVANIDARYIETVAAMGTHHGFLKACAFKEVPQTPAQVEAEIYAAAAVDRCPPHVMLDSDLLIEWVDGLSVRRGRLWRKLAWSHWHHFSIHRRTRAPQPKVIPGPSDERWPDAWQMLAARIGGRPSYWILGPIER
ncbi:MAG: ATP-binding cassette domain-containing protein [Giesbergeria sp.]